LFVSVFLIADSLPKVEVSQTTTNNIRKHPLVSFSSWFSGFPKQHQTDAAQVPNHHDVYHVPSEAETLIIQRPSTIVAELYVPLARDIQVWLYLLGRGQLGQVHCPLGQLHVPVDEHPQSLMVKAVVCIFWR